VKYVSADRLSVTDLETARVLVVQQAMDPVSFDTKVASPARALCDALFGTGTRREVPADWVVNWHTRSLVPHAPTGSPSARPAVSDFFVNSPVGQMLRGITSEESYPDGGRLRYQPVDQANHPLHQDCMFHDPPRFFTIWIPAVPKGTTVNKDVPGLELFLPAVSRRLRMEREEPPTVCREDLAQFMTVKDDPDAFVRPELELGDVLMFRETVPHRSHIPATADAPRVSFDIRWALTGAQAA